MVEDSSLQDMFAALLRTPQVYNLVLLDHLGAYFQKRIEGMREKALS